MLHTLRLTLHAIPPKLPHLRSEQRKFFLALGDPLLEKQYLGHLHALETNKIEGAFDQAIQFASTMTSLRGEAGVVMIDEFQVLTKVYDKRSNEFCDISKRFQKPAEARWCPMVVSGSAVSLVVNTVMGGLLTRRFEPYYLESFDQRHTLEYVYKLSRRGQVKLSEEVALEIHSMTGGIPYYIWCLFYSLGQEVRKLVDERQAAGHHQIAWDSQNGLGSRVNSGLYFYRIKAGEFEMTRKLMLLK